MPQKTNVLNEFYFVYCDARAVDEPLRELIRQPDIKRRWSDLDVRARVAAFHHSHEEHARFIEKLGFVPFIRANDNPALPTIREFFSGPRPITNPFSIVWGNLLNPLRVVHDFQTEADLETVNSALREQAPLRWWQPGPKGRPSYLFGQFLWEIKPSEVSATERELRLIFLAAVKRERSRFERLEQVFSDEADRPTREPITESVQILVWRRDEGKCVKCGSQERLEYDHIIPISRGGSNTARIINCFASSATARRAIACKLGYSAKAITKLTIGAYRRGTSAEAPLESTRIPSDRSHFLSERIAR